MKETYNWYNYKTKDYELFGGPETDEKAKCFIPQNRASQMLFDLYRSHEGLSIIDAMIKVLTANTKGKPQAKPQTRPHTPKNLATRFWHWMRK